jgi:hypothetical protein
MNLLKNMTMKQIQNIPTIPATLANGTILSAPVTPMNSTTTSAAAPKSAYQSRNEITFYV